MIDSREEWLSLEGSSGRFALCGVQEKGRALGLSQSLDKVDPPQADTGVQSGGDGSGEIRMSDSET